MRFWFAGVGALLASTPLFAFAQSAASLDPVLQNHGFNPTFIDRTISPTADFYRYSNGNWLDRTQIPRDQPVVSATALARTHTEEMLWKLATAAAIDHDAAKGSPEQLVGTFLVTALDEDLANRLGKRPIESELTRIAAIQSHGDVVAELARLHRWWISPCFHAEVGFDYRNSTHRILGLSQGDLTLHSRDLYLGDNARAKNLRGRLALSIQDTLHLLGETGATAASDAERVIAIETRMAAFTLPMSETGDIEGNYHCLTIAELKGLAPQVDWDRYFEALGATQLDKVDVEQPAYFHALGDLLAHVPVKDWQTYLRWRLAHATSPFLSADFQRVRFNLEAALSGQEGFPSRPEVTLDAIDSCLGSELGRLMQRTGFGLAAKPKLITMVQSIRTALRDTIERLDWMAPGTKQKALEKLDRMGVNICYPERWRDSSNLDIADDSFWQNVARARDFEFQRQVRMLSLPFDRQEWRMRAYAVDARYDPSLNAIILPAGVMQPPYFDVQSDDASNYGAIGAVIGHEMMHAFDARGRKFDAAGNLNNWWSLDDDQRYEARQKEFIAQYSGYQVQDRLNVDGKLTLEENMADLGGVSVAYAAFKRVSFVQKMQSAGGFTPDQRFFLSFGQLFRTKVRPELERLSLEFDPHSPPKFRVDGVLQNVPEFWRAFNMEPPKHQIRIW